jgi:hypothetical protein
VAEHHDLDIPWHRRPVPARRHKCEAVSTYDTGMGIMQRCACGAARHIIVVGSAPTHIEGWHGRNARRTDPTYKRPRLLGLIRKALT